jgi:hypothetical protein
MANVCRIEGDVFVAGELSSRTMGIPDSTVVNADVSASADIDAEKLEHQFQKVYAQEADTQTVAEQYVVHVCHGSTGTIEAFEAGLATASSNTTQTVGADLINHRAGTTASVLTAAITLDSGNTAHVTEAGTIDTSAIQDGDVLSVKITATDDDGTNVVGKGAFASVKLREDAD